MIRYYLAITNDCNHNCEYCSCYSRPGKNTYMSLDIFTSYIDSTSEIIEVQFEGGEPLMHPDFYKMIDYCIKTNRCDKIIITTNSKLIPYRKEKEWLKFIIDNSTMNFVLKPSINDHLYRNQDNLFEKLSNILDYSKDIPNLTILFNVRMDKTINDRVIMDNIEFNGLKDYSNIFYFQRYGRAKNVDKFEPPFIIENPVEFYLISPDGENFGTDMIKRSEYMKNLD